MWKRDKKYFFVGFLNWNLSTWIWWLASFPKCLSPSSWKGILSATIGDAFVRKNADDNSWVFWTIKLCKRDWIMIPSMGVSTRYQQRNTTMRKAKVIVPGKSTKFIPIVPTPGDDSRKISWITRKCTKPQQQNLVEIFFENNKKIKMKNSSRKKVTDKTFHMESNEWISTERIAFSSWVEIQPHTQSHGSLFVKEIFRCIIVAMRWFSKIRHFFW